jgi:ribosomal-protein-alanine N-acetyltransferase
MNVREFLPEDLPAILAIQRKCTSAAQWSEEDYLQLAGNPGGSILVADRGKAPSSKLQGFVAFHRVIDEAELQNMAVDPENQRRGIGRALLEAGAQRLQSAGVRRIFLEVRTSNTAARRLYSSTGFRARSIRKNYYRDPVEDALVLQMTLPQSPGTPKSRPA